MVSTQPPLPGYQDPKSSTISGLREGCREPAESCWPRPSLQEGKWRARRGEAAEPINTLVSARTPPGSQAGRVGGIRASTQVEFFKRNIQLLKPRLLDHTGTAYQVGLVGCQQRAAEARRRRPEQTLASGWGALWRSPRRLGSQGHSTAPTKGTRAGACLSGA